MIVDLYNTIKAHPEHFKQLECRSLLFTQYDCPQEAIRQDLFSTYHYIAYVLKGKRVFHLPGEKYIMTPGKCVFAKKGGWIAEKEPEQGWCVLVFFITSEYISSFINEYRSSLSVQRGFIATDHQMFDIEVNESSRGFFFSMLPYFDQQPPPPESLVELKFKELLLNLLVNPSNRNFLQWAVELSDNGCRQSLQEVMLSNYTYNLSLGDFARLAGRSVANFKREFQKIYNTTPGKWLIMKRLDYASLLLTSSAKRVNEIAFESGFENTTHFGRVFKERFGKSPLQFRNLPE